MPSIIELPDPRRAPRQRFMVGNRWLRMLNFHWGVPTALYTPLIAWLVWRAVGAQAFYGATWISVACGMCLWTLLEYWIHRVLLHPDATSWYRFISENSHKPHHEHPEDVTQVILTPLLTAPLALLLYGALRWALPESTAGAVIAGVMLGYLAYDIAHYYFHAPVKLPFRWLEDLQKDHALHHFKTPDLKFGVTTTLWDKVFGTS